jgi:hypothetical protein
MRELTEQIERLRDQLLKLSPEAPDRPRLESSLRQAEEELRRVWVQQPPAPARPPVERPRPITDPDQVRAWLRENEPETYARLMRLQEDGRRPEVLEILAAAEGRMAAMAEMKERDPRGYERLQEMRKLEVESFQLAHRAKAAPPEERDRAVKHLGELLGRLFDLREESRARELAELKRRVEELEKNLSGRKANKERIVDRRRKELLGERIDEDW